MTIPGTAGSDVNPYNPGGELTNTEGMHIPHSVFRGEFGIAARTVRAQPPGDAGRAQIVGENTRFLIEGLTGHHEAEDLMLWPRLHERVDDPSFQATVDLMERQHHGIHESLETVLAANKAWMADPSVQRRDSLADALDRANEVLCEHLEAEETLILPVAARTISKQEWDELSAHGMNSIPKTRRSLSLGAIHYYAPPELWPEVTSIIPWFLRPLAVRQGDKAFRKAALEVHGTATP